MQSNGNGPLIEHEGMFHAANVLGAIGQACLHFAVTTRTIVQLEVHEAEGDSKEMPSSAKDADEPSKPARSGEGTR